VRVGLYADNTLPLAVGPICDALNSLCREVHFAPGEETFRLTAPRIHPPTSPKLLTPALRAETATFDLTCLTTCVPYENNFFFESIGDQIVLSFSGWNTLTDLPISNGLVYFAALLILRKLGIGPAHDEATGCINDFRWDKRGVDVGMRAAFVCKECLEQIPNDSQTQDAVNDVHAVLDVLSRASRAHLDILAVAVDAQAHRTRGSTCFFATTAKTSRQFGQSTSS
jgi:hypothetical protein